MPEQLLDVLLITDDPALADEVNRRRPAAARLRAIGSAVDSTELAGSARQLWLDLESPLGAIPGGGARRVYFHTAPRPAAEDLPPGLFIRKPCPLAVLDVLWAGACPRGAQAWAESDEWLPGWLLDFQELNLKLLCRQLVLDLPKRLGFVDASLYLFDELHGLLTLAETTHTRPIDLAIRADSPEHLVAAVGREGRLLRTRRVADELRRFGISPHGERAYADEACLVAPLRSDDRLWGVLSLSRDINPAGQAEPCALEPLFAFLGRAVHHAIAYGAARTEARVDGLTGLFNQRWMTEALEKEIRRAQRYQAALSVLMIDLDGLKGVNDGHGHAAGDALLRHTAGRIAAVLRQFDGAARVGGDEFVVMLPATNLAGARQVGRRLLESIAAEPAVVAGTPLPITASIGVAEWRSGWDAQQLLAAADRAMYCAKWHGRDKLVCEGGTIRLGEPRAGENAPVTSNGWAPRSEPRDVPQPAPVAPSTPREPDSRS